jgi:catechol 2,3-dioxygenase
VSANKGFDETVAALRRPLCATVPAGDHLQIPKTELGAPIAELTAWCIRYAAREDVQRLERRGVCWRAVNFPNERSNMIKLQRLGHVLISVRDLERSRDFYTRILGFKVLEQDPDHGGLFLSVGGLGNTLDLFPCKNPQAVAASDADLAGRNGLGLGHMAFAVETEDDLRDAYFALQAAGVPILRAIDHVSQKSVYFHDPDKNLLEIVWERPDALEIFARGRGDEDKPLTFSR